MRGGKILSNLLSYFPQFSTTDSLFQKMISFGAPWSGEQGLSMDVSYFTLWSGLSSPSIFTRTNSVNSIADSETIAKILWDIYGTNWKRLWDALNTEYNPIDNYNLSETVNRNQNDNRNIEKSGTSDVTDNLTSSGNSTRVLDQSVVDDGTTTLQHGENIMRDSETDDFVYGFNSLNKVPTDVSIQTSTESHTGADTTTIHDKTDTDSTVTDDYSNTSKDVIEQINSETTKDEDSLIEDITRTRAGNVGQNSYQELLRQEFDLWKWNFFVQVFRDVDRFLIISIFDPCNLVN